MTRRKFYLEDLDDADFELVVVGICRKILGVGVTSFCAGRDGGRDARFEGKTECFPSSASPIEGRIVVQAKHTINSDAACHDTEFEGIVKKEIPRIKRQLDEKELTHYIMFTNRRKSGGADSRIVNMIRDGAGLQDVWLRGREDIEADLRSYRDIVQEFGVDRPQSAIMFMPDDLRDVIVAFYENRPIIQTSFDSQHDLRPYPGLPKKNELNGLGAGYYRSAIEGRSSIYFADIRAFLLDPRNDELAAKYHATADELNSQLALHRSDFEDFGDALDSVYQQLYDSSPVLQKPAHRIMSHVFVHYMYATCDVGLRE